MQPFYERLVRFTHDGIFRYRFDDGVILQANQGLADILDLDATPADIAGKPLSKLMRYLQPPGEIRRRLAEASELHGYEYHFQTLKGEERWILYDSFLGTDPDTGGLVVETIITNITPLRKATRIIEEERERLDVTLRSIGEGLIATDSDGRVQLMNPEAEKLTGRPLAEAVGLPLDQVFKTIDEVTRATLETPVQRMLCDGARIDLPNHSLLLSRNGTERPIAGSACPLRNKRGTVSGLVLVFQDQTQERAARNALAFERNELARSNRELERFAYVSSHDLNEPLRMVSAFTKLLRDRYQGRLDDTADQYIAFALEGANRMRALIAGILDYSRLGNPERLRVLNAGEPLRAALDNLKQIIDSTGAEIQVHPMPDVTADDVQLTQVFQNLIGNAIKFRGKSPPRIRISAARIETAWQFSVEDNGIGIEPAYWSKIFEVFQRLHTQDQYSGTGIGLATCQKIIERHGGRIWVESKPGEGSTFHFTIPQPPHSRPGGQTAAQTPGSAS